MPDKTCFVDLDGTVVDLVSGLARQHRLELTRHTWPLTYDLEVATGLSPARIWGHPGVVGARFWRELDPLPWAAELVGLAQDLFEHVEFLTQPVRDPGCAQGKREWAARHFPGVPITVMPRKWELARTRPGVLVDDHAENVERWTEAGCQAVLVPAPWNPLHPERHDPMRLVRARLLELAC